MLLAAEVVKGDEAHRLGLAFARAWASADLQEGLAAFRDRRRPVFRGT
jgi:enoyl-CoA hydratase/carnithine racemase